MSKPKPLSTEVAKIYEKSNKGVVIFSFGSIANTDLLPEHIRMAYLEAFSDFPEYEFIWKYHLRENDTSLFARYKNVHPVEWLEQNSLLAHRKTKAFMTHGGLNSLIESSFNGIPLIVTPLFGDQNYNTYIVKQKEIGVYINFKEISVTVIKVALKEVLYSDRYYQNAQKLKKRLHLYPYNAREKFVKYLVQQ
uniref:glucuronosyltransferase n=1 Tax=Acrobeloides nanus TaxID=290746 RepID=A0A914DQ19_9BILA